MLLLDRRNCPAVFSLRSGRALKLFAPAQRQDSDLQGGNNMEFFGGFLFLIYCAAGFWATKWTIYYNKIVVEFQPMALFSKRLLYGIVLGWALIPWAIIRKLTLKNGG